MIHKKQYTLLTTITYYAPMYTIWYNVHTNFHVSSLCAQVIKMVDDGYRLPPPPGLSKELYKIMIHCWYVRKINFPIGK